VNHPIQTHMYSLANAEIKSIMSIPQTNVRYIYAQNDQNCIISENNTELRFKMTDEEKPKEPGLFSKFNAYIAKNQAANRRAGDKPLSEELSSFGSDWGKNFSKGMAEVGNEEEAKLNKKPKVVHDDDGLMDEIIFGKKKPKTNQTPNKEEPVQRGEPMTDEAFTAKLCDFMRYVNEDDEVELYQHRGSTYTKVDYKYMGKLLTRYMGHKVTLKERDLSIK